MLGFRSETAIAGEKGGGVSNEVIVANCGLVCSACGVYTRGKCDGCFGEKPMFRNCPVKKCTAERGYATCAECTQFAELKRCKKLNNPISKIVGFIFRTNRVGNLTRIRRDGLEAFKREY
jgi:hypothetical protein